MKTLGMFTNMEKPSAVRVLDEIGRLADKLGLRLVDLNRKSSDGPDERMDMLLALGGDGTMLKAVRMLKGRAVPVLGVNLGSLGFLTSVSEHDIEKALRCLAEGEFTVSVRHLAECAVVRSEKKREVYQAVNDIVITCGASARIITLDILIDDVEVISCRGDGLIVSTPTGSTGHSLSAGGPILHPESEAFVISLICPHTLSARPLVVPDRKKITVVVEESAGDILLSVDGQTSEPLKVGDRITVGRSKKQAHFIYLPDHSYFSVLRHKLHWRGSAV